MTNIEYEYAYLHNAHDKFLLTPAYNNFTPKIPKSSQSHFARVDLLIPQILSVELNEHEEPISLDAQALGEREPFFKLKLGEKDFELKHQPGTNEKN